MKRKQTLSDRIDAVAEPNLVALTNRARRFAQLSREEREHAWQNRGMFARITDQSGQNHYRKVNTEPRHFAAFMARNPHYEPVPFDEVVSGFVINAENAQNVAGIAAIGGDCILMRCDEELHQERERLRKKRQQDTKDVHNREYREAIERIEADSRGAIRSQGPKEIVQTIEIGPDPGLEVE